MHRAMTATSLARQIGISASSGSLAKMFRITWTESISPL
jgi:hypothetical protein